MVDLLVGLFVGLLVGLAVYSTTIFMTQQRRTTMSGDSALENALAGLHAIQFDAKNAGLGVWLNGQAACKSINVYHDGKVIADGIAMAPVVIVPGDPDTVSDEITFLSTDSILGAVPLPLIAGMPTPSSILKAMTNDSVAEGDFIIVANLNSDLPCTLMQVTHVADTGFGTDLQHNPGSSAWNPPNPEHTFTNAPAYPAGSLVFDIGRLRWVTYRIRDNNLEAYDVVNDVATVIADNVVALKAHYGTSNGVMPQIEQWVPATDSWAGPLDAAHVRAVRAVRLAVVARSAHPEKPQVRGGACDTTTEAPRTWENGPVIDLSADPDWRCYRYRTFTLVVPLKNLLFEGATS